MNKSISVFVFDTPESCDECRLMYSYYDPSYGWIKECMGSGVNDCIVFGKKLEDYCPLKPLPQKRELEESGNSLIDDCKEYYTDGWNECIDEILGENVKG